MVSHVPLLVTSLLASTTVSGLPATTWHASSFGMALLATAAFGVLGVAILALGFKLFELLTPRLDIEKQLEEKNLAVAIVVAALLLGLSWIIVRSLG